MSSANSRTNNDVVKMARQTAAKMPNLIYGTAWKKDQTRGLVKQALLAGFRGVDTAAQPKHYQEELVGLGIRDAMAEAGLRREDLYVSPTGLRVNRSQADTQAHRFRPSSHLSKAKMQTTYPTIPIQA